MEGFSIVITRRAPWFFWVSVGVFKTRYTIVNLDKPEYISTNKLGYRHIKSVRDFCMYTGFWNGNRKEKFT